MRRDTKRYLAAAAVLCIVGLVVFTQDLFGSATHDHAHAKKSVESELPFERDEPEDEEVIGVCQYMFR